MSEVMTVGSANSGTCPLRLQDRPYKPISRLTAMCHKSTWRQS